MKKKLLSPAELKEFRAQQEEARRLFAEQSNKKRLVGPKELLGPKPVVGVVEESVVEESVVEVVKEPIELLQERVEEFAAQYSEELAQLQIHLATKLEQDDINLDPVNNNIKTLRDIIDELPEVKYYDEDLEKLTERVDQLQVFGSEIFQQHGDNLKEVKNVIHQMLEDLVKLDKREIPEAFDPTDIQNDIATTKEIFYERVAELKKELSELPEVKYYDDELTQLQEKIEAVRDSIPEVPEIKYYDDDLKNLLGLIEEVRGSLPEMPEVRYYESEIAQLEEAIKSVEDRIPTVPEVRYYEDDIEALREEIKNVEAQIPEVPEIPEIKYYDEDIDILSEDIDKIRDSLIDIKLAIRTVEKSVEVVEGCEIPEAFDPTGIQLDIEKAFREIEKLKEQPVTLKEDTDPLTPLEAKFVTFDDLRDHYRKFINRVQQQLSSLGGGGEVNLRYLDDIDRSSISDGKVLSYDAATKKFKFISPGAASSLWSEQGANIYRNSNVGIGTALPRFTLEVGAVGAAETSLWVNGHARITGILSVGQGTVTIDGNANTINVSNIVVENSIVDSTGVSYATTEEAGIPILDSMADFATADTTKTLVFLKQYYADYTSSDLGRVTNSEPLKGGGFFKWDPTVLRRWHDGGIHISPSCPYDGTRTNLENFHERINDPHRLTSTEYGCWVRQFEGEVQAEFFGCVGNGVVDDQPAIQKALHTISDFNKNSTDVNTRWKYTKVQIRGNCRIKKYIEVPEAMVLYGDENTQAYTNQNAGFRYATNWINSPTITVDPTIQTWSNNSISNERATIVLRANQSGFKGIVLDGYEIPYGTTYSKLFGEDSNGTDIVYGPMEFRVLDPNDPRQGRSYNNLEIDTHALPGVYAQEDFYHGYQLYATGGNRTGVPYAGGTASNSNVTAANPYAWTATNLPTGWSLSSSGWLTFDDVNYNFTVGETDVTFTVEDAEGATSTKILKLRVHGKCIAGIEAGLLPACVGSSYSFQGGILLNPDGQSHLWWMFNGPDGLYINQSTGEIYGTPTANSRGEYQLTIVLTNAVSGTNFYSNTVIDRIEYTFHVYPNDEWPKFYKENIDRPIHGQYYEFQLKAYNAPGPFTWSINTNRINPSFPHSLASSGYPTSTSPAPGLTLSSSGLISGTYNNSNESAQSLNFYVTITSSNGKSAEEWISIRGRSTPLPPVVKLGKFYNFPVAVKGQPYSYQVISTDAATNPIGFTTEAPNAPGVVLNNFPSGIGIGSTGLISGTPTGYNQVNGIAVQWGAFVKDTHIRNFPNGVGIKAVGPTNLHLFQNLFVDNCDIGLELYHWYDSRIQTFYIYNCRIGIECEGGVSANTITDGRIEFIHEYGWYGNMAPHQIMNHLYFDTCGYASIYLNECEKNTITGTHFYRSGRRQVWRGKHYKPRVEKEYSSHVVLKKCNGITFSGNVFSIGSGGAGTGSGVDASIDEWTQTTSNDGNTASRPSTCFWLDSNENIIIDSNDLTGSVDSPITTHVYGPSVAILSGNTVREKGSLSPLISPSDPLSGKNLFADPKRNWWETDDALEYDPYWSNGNSDATNHDNQTCLLSHGEDFTDYSRLASTSFSGNVTNSTVRYKFGSKSFYFDGSSYLETGNVGFVFGFDPFTFEFWVNSSTVGISTVRQTIFDTQGTWDSSTLFALCLETDGHLTMRSNRTSSTPNGTVRLRTEGTLTADTWHHIVWMKTGGYGGGKSYIYIDGVVQNNTLNQNQNYIDQGTNPSLGYIQFMGSRPHWGRAIYDTTQEYFTGYIDEIRITKGIARYENMDEFTLQQSQFADSQIDVPSTGETLIFSPPPSGSADTDYRVGLTELYGPTKRKLNQFYFRLGSEIINPVKVTRYSSNTELADRAAGAGALPFFEGIKQPSDYFIRVQKEAVSGASSGTYQMCEFRVPLCGEGDWKLFNRLRGRRVATTFWGRCGENQTNDQYSVPMLMDQYVGAPTFASINPSLGSVNFYPFWRKFYIEFDLEHFYDIPANTDGCVINLRFAMTDQAQDFDLYFGGFMFHTAPPFFGLTNYTEDVFTT